MHLHIREKKEIPSINLFKNESVILSIDPPRMEDTSEQKFICLKNNTGKSMKAENKKCFFHYFGKNTCVFYPKAYNERRKQGGVIGVYESI